MSRFMVVVASLAIHNTAASSKQRGIPKVLEPWRRNRRTPAAGRQRAYCSTRSNHCKKPFKQQHAGKNCTKVTATRLSPHQTESTLILSSPRADLSSPARLIRDVTDNFARGVNRTGVPSPNILTIFTPLAPAPAPAPAPAAERKAHRASMPRRPSSSALVAETALDDGEAQRYLDAPAPLATGVCGGGPADMTGGGGLPAAAAPGKKK